VGRIARHKGGHAQPLTENDREHRSPAGSKHGHAPAWYERRPGAAVHRAWRAPGLGNGDADRRQFRSDRATVLDRTDVVALARATEEQCSLLFEIDSNIDVVLAGSSAICSFQ
jgi:hypothetical protein